MTEKKHLEVDTPNGVPFDHRKTYYISGPMSGYPGFNYETFAEACDILESADIKYESPHLCFPNEPTGVREYEEYMQAGFEMLKRCQGIIMLPGFPRSTGAIRELTMAIDLNFPVYLLYEMGDVAVLACMNRQIPT